MNVLLNVCSNPAKRKRERRNCVNKWFILMQDVYHTFLGKVRFPELSTNPFFETFYVLSINLNFVVACGSIEQVYGAGSIYPI